MKNAGKQTAFLNQTFRFRTVKTIKNYLDNGSLLNSLVRHPLNWTAKTGSVWFLKQEIQFEI